VSGNDSLSLSGRTIAGHFLVEGVSGEGRHSLIYRGRQVGPDEPVALRVLKFGGSTEPGAVELFVKRWRTDSNAVAGVVLGDPQLVRTIELGTAATGVGTFAPFIATEWLEGKPLTAEIASRGKGIAIKDVLKLLEPASVALAYAHRSGAAHGRLTSRSLFIANSEDGPQLRVLDLGMWLVLAELTRDLPKVASLLVTPWSAPEHLDPSIGDVGLQTDVYALALILIEMLRGKPVLPADATDEQIRRAVLDAKAPRTAKELGLTIGGHLERALSRALSRDPADRWPDIGVFWNAVRGSIADDEAGLPVPNWTDGEHDTARRFVVPPDLPTDRLTPTGLTPTGATPTGKTGTTSATPTGLTPTGPTNPTGPTPTTLSEPRLPEFDDGETTEMPTFGPGSSPRPAIENGIRPSSGPISERSPGGIVRPLDEEDLTPVQFTSSQRQRAAQKSAPPPPVPSPREPVSVDVNLDDTDERPPFVPPPTNGPSQSERRRAAKPGDPPLEAAGSGRATGLRVMKPAPAAKVNVDDLPSVIVDDAALDDSGSYRDSPRQIPNASPRPPTPMVANDDKTVVQLEPPAHAASRSPTRPTSRQSVPERNDRGERTRSMPAPAPARHYGAGRRARERRQLLIVGFAVFLAVAVATALALGLRGAFGP
jgi:serine/threonine-protein kinase